MTRLALAGLTRLVLAGLIGLAELIRLAGLNGFAGLTKDTVVVPSTMLGSGVVPEGVDNVADA